MSEIHMGWTICYLCGNPLTAPWNRDHVPPRQFFGKVFRRSGELDSMDWLPTHVPCNSAYGEDEEYFTTTFATVSVKSPTGRALLDDIVERLRRGKQVALSRMVDAELKPVSCEDEGWFRKSFVRNRTDRVVWKIVRGLHYLRTGRYLPERTAHKVWFGYGDNGIPGFLTPVADEPSEGKYGMVCDYRVFSARINEEQLGHIYLIVFFDSVVYGLTFEEWQPLILTPKDFGGQSSSQFT